MTNNYVKVTASEKPMSKVAWIAPSERDESGDEEKTVACEGYVGAQEFFFFDDRNPDSIRKAYEEGLALALAGPARLSIFRRPKISGPWDGAPIVGEFISVRAETVN